MSRKLCKITVCLLILGAVGSCKKQRANVKSGFVAVLDNNDDIITRTCAQLKDGSYLISGLRQSDKNSILAKISQKGNFEWQKTLSGDFKEIHHLLAEENGTFLIAAFDSLEVNKNFVLGRFDGSGHLLNIQRTRHVPGPKSDYFSAEIIKLKNNQIACLTQGAIEGFDWYTYPRLLIFNQDLTIASERTYKDSFQKNFIGIYKLRLRQAQSGNVIITGNYLFRNIVNQSIDAYGIIMNIDPQNFEMSNYHYLTQEPGQLPGESQIMTNGNICFAQPPQTKSTSLGEYINYFYRDYYSRSNQIFMREVLQNGTLVRQESFGGFPKLGTAIKMIKLRGGGFAIAGLCNYNEDYTASNIQSMLVILSDDMKLQWLRIFKSAYPIFVSDLIETSDGGFALACFSQSFGKKSKMMLIKTDSHGN